jgi:GTP:adenosylcobinamide-phosphate guanylyltransferase
VKGAIMAGGRGTRFTPLKPILKVCDEPMILRVHKVLSDFVDEVTVATVRGHPAEKILREIFPRIIYTSGKGYEHDVLEVVRELGVPLLISSADLPFLPKEAVRLLMDSCSASVCTLEDELGFVGVSFWRGTNLGDYMSVSFPGTIINVNTVEDYDKANKKCK